MTAPSPPAPVSAVDYDADADTYTARLDWTAVESVSTAVVFAVAAAVEVDPATLQPIFESVDPDALDALYGSRRNGALADVEVTLPVDEFEVTLRIGGEMVIRERA